MSSFKARLKRIFIKVLNLDPIIIEKEDITYIEKIEYVLANKGIYSLDENAGIGYVLKSYNTAKAAREDIIKEIKKAKKSVKIVIYSINDKVVLSALKKLENVEVTIITDSNRVRGKYLFAQKNFSLYEVLVKSSQIFHPKFCIIDDNICFVGSYNFTKKSLENDEFVVKAKGEELMKSLNNYFEQRKEEAVCDIYNGKIFYSNIRDDVG